MLTLDPLLDTISYWRTNQNIVLLQFLRQWQLTPPHLKADLHYRVVRTEERRYLLDPHDLVACEFNVYGDVISVNWMRSWKDFDRMKRVVRSVKEKMEEGETLARRI
jgi:hypothetical protein